MELLKVSREVHVMFQKAKTIFLHNLRDEMNVSAIFKTKFINSGENVRLIITGATFYRIIVNDNFVGYGPAKAPKGYTRVDEIDLNDYVCDGDNCVTIELSSYGCDSFYAVNVPGFLQAEILIDGMAVAATGYDFKGFLNTEREQKVMRYSFQRHFSEVYRCGSEDLMEIPVEIVETGLTLIPRVVPFPDYAIVSPAPKARRGELTEDKKEEYQYQRYVDNISDDSTKGSNGFEKEEILYKPLYDMMDKSYTITDNDFSYSFPLHLVKGEYVIFDMKRNTVGFIRHAIRSLSDKCRVVIGINERDKNGAFFPMENDITNVVDYHMSAGDFEKETFEVYGFRYLYFCVLEGEIDLLGLEVREYAYRLKSFPAINTDNIKLEKIYNAAVETFRQNTLDVFMDCPTRERAGWFMDGLFTARAEYFLTGKTVINEVMLKNVVDATDFPNIPDGMIPMCYPAETMGMFIPQWAMWYGVQVYEQVIRTGQSPEPYKKVLYGIYSWLSRHENESGLLEKLEGWNFVEWSRCNDEDWIQDVNYPTNMLYSFYLEKLGEMYQDTELCQKSEHVKKMVLEKSFNGVYFVENARYDENGVLKNTQNVSETCQYYAIWTGVANLEEEKFSCLKSLVLDTFGVFGTHEFEPYEPSNAFNGFYLRMEILLRMNQKELLQKEIEDFFGGMVQKSGTLWEHKTASNSMNHGFASWVAEVIYKCVV